MNDFTSEVPAGKRVEFLSPIQLKPNNKLSVSCAGCFEELRADLIQLPLHSHEGHPLFYDLFGGDYTCPTQDVESAPMGLSHTVWLSLTPVHHSHMPTHKFSSSSCQGTMPCSINS